MTRDYLPYLVIVAGGLAIWGVAAWGGWLHRRDEERVRRWNALTPEEQAALAEVETESAGSWLILDDPTEPDDLMAVADAVAEDTCSTPDEEPTAQYEPCGHTWHDRVESIQHGRVVWAITPCGDGGHRCTRAPGSHDRHICLCGAEEYAGPVLIVDPPTVRQYVMPAPDAEWVTFGKHRVHQRCMDARRDAKPITDGCAAHLIGAATDLPAGGAA